MLPMRAQECRNHILEFRADISSGIPVYDSYSILTEELNFEKSRIEIAIDCYVLYCSVHLIA